MRLLDATTGREMLLTPAGWLEPGIGGAELCVTGVPPGVLETGGGPAGELEET